VVQASGDIGRGAIASGRLANGFAGNALDDRNGFSANGCGAAANSGGGTAALAASGFGGNGVVRVAFATAGVRLDFAGSGGALVRAAGAGGAIDVGRFGAGARSDSLGCCTGGNTPEAGRVSLEIFSVAGGTELREGVGGGQVLRAGDFADCCENCDSLERGRLGADVDIDAADGVARSAVEGVLERDELGAGVLERDELAAGLVARGGELGAVVRASGEVGAGVFTRAELAAVFERAELGAGVLACGNAGVEALADELDGSVLARSELDSGRLARGKPKAISSVRA
jgi:hypothetical protein